MTSLKHEIETWNEGVQLFDQEHFDEAIEVFESIGDSAKYHFNIGVVLMTMGDFESATVAFSQATKMDKYLSVAYFQNGIAHVALENYEISVKCFNLAYFYLRGNDIIDYTQLGLDFKLYKCQILYNLALCRIELGELRLAMGDLEQAKLAKQTKDHDIIDEAYKDRGVNHTVMTIPRGVLYRPSASKVRDSKKKDYLGNARVIAEVNPAGDFKGFKGTSAWKMQMSGPTNIASSGSNPLSTPQVSNAGRRYSAWINDLSTKQKELEAIRATPAMPPPKALGRSNTEVRPSMGRGRSPSPAAPVASVVPVAPPAPPAPPAPATLTILQQPVTQSRHEPYLVNRQKQRTIDPHSEHAGGFSKVIVTKPIWKSWRKSHHFRVKCHFPESPKPLSVAVTLDQHSTHKELQNILMDKLQLSHPPILKYKDGEDILSIIGDDDWMTALDVHRPIEGAAFRMDIWCYDDW
ncbi:hypothetical protein BGX31_002201 [Mortierella sp. GBA43]|nr:hypothetical protein BGX31_002201 [Mortierella sp. GBA43]